MNIIVFVALSDKKILSPATVLMQGLALADGLTSLCTYGFEPIFSPNYEEIGYPTTENNFRVFVWKQLTTISIDEIKMLVDLKFPYCLLHYCVTNSIDMFHLVSILLTTSLGLQKFLAVVFPIWSRCNLTNRKSVFVCVICFIISFTLNIPRMFVVSVYSENGDACSMSRPHKALQKYVLTFYPILFAVILAGAIITMLVSSLYIIFILCRRKRVRGRNKVSKAEKKSSTLILCVMIVFLLSEVPRIYINATLFDTYRSDIEKTDIAFYKVRQEIEKKLSPCLNDASKDIIMRSRSENNLTGANCVPRLEHKLMAENLLSSHLLLNLRFGLYNYKFLNTIKPVYIELVNKRAKEIDESVVQTFRQTIRRYLAILQCNGIKIKAFRNSFTVNDIAASCWDSAIPQFYNDLPFLLLGSNPYSEPMNYILNIIWGRIDLSLYQLKIISEILKLSMIVGCASNFLIYIIMSRKLREALINKVKCTKRASKTKL